MGGMEPFVDTILLLKNDIVREGLRHILAERGFNIVELSDSARRVPVRDDDRPVLVILDGSLLVHDDLSELHEARRRVPGARVAVLSDGFDLDLMIELFGAGAQGYMLKEVACDPLTCLLRLVWMGERVAPSDLIDAIPSALKSSRSAPDETIETFKLSDREREILDCLILGYSNKVISRRLLVTEATVKAHVKVLFRKLRVTNRTQAAIFALDRSSELLRRKAEDGFIEVHDPPARIMLHATPVQA